MNSEYQTPPIQTLLKQKWTGPIDKIGIYLSAEMDQNIYYTHIYSLLLQANYLPYPVKAFGDSECVETKSENFKNPLEYYSVYSPYACMVECRSKFVQKQCHCTPTYGVGKILPS